MAELSKQALKVQNNTEFPNNNAGLITPSNLRGFNVDMIDSLVDEISYNADSASWNQQIDALEQFTASATGLTTGSLLVTASASGNTITFTKGDASTFNVVVATGSIPDISALNQATASLQAFTASAAISITNLNASSASQQISINALNTNSASVNTSITNLNASSASQQISIDSLNSKTGSYATTGSNVFTGANTFTSISASSFISASEFIGNGSKITGITASISLPILDEGIPQGNAVSLNFTGSAIRAVVVGGTAVISVDAISTSSLNDLTASFQAYTASTDADLAAIHQATASLQSNSASVNISITNLNASSASQQISIDALNANSASVNTSISALNSFSASQTIVDSAFAASITNLNSATASLFGSASLALVTASFNNGTRNLTFTKGDTTTFSVNIPDVSGSAGDFVTTASFNAYTQSNDQRVTSLEANTASVATSITNINSATSSLFTSASLGLVTASISGINLTFTKGDGTQFTLQTATGSVVSASYAETASLAINAKDIIVNVKNTTGTQINKGTVVRIIGATGDNPLIGTASWTDDDNSANTLGFVTADIPNDTFGTVMTQGTLLGVNTDPTLGYTAGQLIYLSGSGQYTNVKPPAPYHEVRLGQVLRAQSNNGSVYVLIQNGYELSELHDVDLNTGSLANNNLLAYDSASAQWTNKTITQVGAATTGSNTFTGSQTIQSDVAINNGRLSITGQTSDGPVWLLGQSGSLVLTNNATTPTYASLSHIISSQPNSNTNILFKTNTGAVTTIVSGSGNIFSNQANVTAGFNRYVGGSGNIYPNVLPQLTGSAAFPVTMANNISNSGVVLRAPISSSTYTLSSNLLINAAGTALNFGPAGASNFERAVSGLTVQNNIIAGNINAIAFKTPLSASVLVSSNMIGGAVTLNMDSSSVSFSGNTVQGTLTINNSYFPSTINPNSATGVNGNIFIGTHTVFASGSNATFTAPRIVQNVGLIGNANVVSASLNGDNSNAIATILLGQSLVAVGSNTRQAGQTMPDYGTVFVGRWNDINGTRDMTAETVFAVGTGTGEATRKTGFLIDSGSNTFVEGTLNVSGSSSFTGSVAGNVVSASITSNTASINFNLGNYFEVTSSVTPLHLNVTNITPGRTSTLIISASASSSITFSPNVAQPSGSAYSGSLGSIDILSLVAFNTSKVNLVSTKALV